MIFSVQIAEIPPQIKIGVIWTRLEKQQHFENKTAKMRKCLMKFSRNFECGAVQKRANLVDLVKSFHASIYYSFAKFGVDTAENGPLKVCQKLVNS